MSTDILKNWFAFHFKVFFKLWGLLEKCFSRFCDLCMQEWVLGQLIQRSFHEIPSVSNHLESCMLLAVSLCT